MEKLAHPILEAFELIGVGKTRGFALIKSGELKTFWIGRKRFTTPEWLREFVEEQKRKSGAISEAA